MNKCAPINFFTEPRSQYVQLHIAAATWRIETKRFRLWTDYSGLVLVLFDLQVKSPDGQWIDAVPIASTVLVNIADLMQRWTADRLLSTVRS